MASARTLEAGIRKPVPDRRCPSFSPYSTASSDKFKMQFCKKWQPTRVKKAQSLHDSLPLPQVQNLQEPEKPQWNWQLQPMTGGSKFWRANGWKKKFNLTSCDTVTCGISAIINTYCSKNKIAPVAFMLLYFRVLSQKTLPRKSIKQIVPSSHPL